MPVHFKKPILLGLLLLTIAVATDIAGPFIAKEIIDNYMEPGNIEVRANCHVTAVIFWFSVCNSYFPLFYVYLFCNMRCKSCCTKNAKRCVRAYSKAYQFNTLIISSR